MIDFEKEAREYYWHKGGVSVSAVPSHANFGEAMYEKALDDVITKLQAKQPLQNINAAIEVVRRLKEASDAR